jgi:hypothetical protein
MFRYKLLILAAMGMLGATCSSISASAQTSGNTTDDGIGRPLFMTEGLTPIPRTTNTVPHWTSAFTYSQITYPFTMVGTNPASRGVTTTVPVAMIPVKFVFADGRSLDGTTTLANTLASPIFQDFSYTTGTTQFGDAIMRAEFWPNISTASSGWHVLLGNPTIYPTQVINVPPGQAVRNCRSPAEFIEAVALVVERPNGDVSPQTSNPSHNSAHLHTYNIFGYLHDLNICCLLGFHRVYPSSNGNGNQSVHTFIVDSWLDHGIFMGSEDVLPLSHEVSEWLNDPFANNLVPPWEFPDNLGCQGLLETGDPIEVLPNDEFPITLSGFTYHVQNEALLQWFSREVPSSAIGGAYSFPDTTVLTSPSQPCH